MREKEKEESWGDLEEIERNLKGREVERGRERESRRGERVVVRQMESSTE